MVIADIDKLIFQILRHTVNRNIRKKLFIAVGSYARIRPEFISVNGIRKKAFCIHILDFKDIARYVSDPFGLFKLHLIDLT